MESPTLLIYTVGGSFEPLVQTLCDWRAARVVFVPSKQAKVQINAILGVLGTNRTPLTPRSHERFPISAPESPDECLHVERQLYEEVCREPAPAIAQRDMFA